MAALAVGREEELLAQLRALLFLPAASPAPPSAPPAAPAVKEESAAGLQLAAIVVSTGTGGGRGSGPAAAAAAAAAAASSSGMAGRRRRRRGDRDDDDSDAKDEQHDEDEAPTADDDSRPQHYPPRCKRRKKKQQSTKSIVTSVPDFDGYQWRKYGHKQIEGAMYPRSYYRCTRSAEQGCAAKRTVQRNDDGGDAANAAAPQYTVVYVAEHTCTANDSLEAPVILETTTVVVPSSAAASTTTNKGGQPQDDHSTYTDSSIVPTTSAGSCSTTTVTTGTESPAIFGDDVTCWSSSGTSSSDYNYADDCYCGGSLFAAAAHGGGWATGPAADSASLQEMEDLTGPIRSPVHVSAPCWAIDQLLLQLDNEPLLCQSYDGLSL